MRTWISIAGSVALGALLAGPAASDDLSCISDTDLQSVGITEKFKLAQAGSSGQAQDKDQERASPGEGSRATQAGQPRSGNEGRAAEGAPSGQQGGSGGQQGQPQSGGQAKPQ